MADRPNVLLFGTGAVGSVYLYLLSKHCDTTAICRSNYAAAKANGFTIHSPQIFGETLHFNPRVARTCAEATTLDVGSPAKPFDYIVICSKVTPNTIPALIAPAVTPNHTVIVLLQNGINIEAEYTAAFPTNPIISGVVYLPVTQTSPGVIQHGDIERLELGAYPSSASSAPTTRFAELIQAGGGTAEVWDDVQFKRWAKLLVNGSWNPICALTRSSDVRFMASSAGATDFVFAMMLELVAIAKAHGYANVDEKVARAQLERFKKRIETSKGVGSEPSMLTDVREGRRMEVEAIVGNAVRMAKEKGVDCVRLETVYFLAKGLDEAIGRALKGSK
ncbi:2-dehydropantoate 2-reductase [Mytilinidion resinicola]|uniref:2-dehydropantoate 2-reductase n=1 Tax=Mytilinidion resinicola TaxID=574789 RepID=A0A6A6YTS4_9PEZI|nr:2-dehydropantoate 2-reductase [Mytilinidion resinicola]KAF2812322.1 2-dehydropantoate 2-reductase [Mytilinidion resinicola]